MLELFLTFLKIGFVSFGGGYGMISLIKEEVLLHNWITEETFTNFIAISESTPGPFAVNIATFIGSTQGGFIGALLASLGVVLPSFIIILLVAAVMKNIFKFAGVKAFLSGVRPVVVGLIVATGLGIFISVIAGIQNINSDFSFDWKAIVIFSIILTIDIVLKVKFKKKVSPILLILISAVLGLVLYGLI